MKAMTPQDAFEEKARHWETEPERVAGLTARYQFDIAGDGGGTWTLDIKDGAARVTQGAAEGPDAIVHVSAGDFVDMCTGALSGHSAFMTGRLRVDGDLDRAMRLAVILA